MSEGLSEADRVEILVLDEMSRSGKTFIEEHLAGSLRFMKQADVAVRRAERSLLGGKKYQSEIAMWRAVRRTYASEFAKIGVNITFESRSKKSKKLATQRIGQY